MDAKVIIYLAVFLALVVLVLAVCLWLLGTAYLYLVRKRFAHIPRPKMPSFYFGHLSAIVEKAKDDGKIGELMLEWGRECGPLFVYFVMHHPFVLILNPDDIKEVLMTARIPKHKKSYERLSQLFGQRFLGRGLLTVPDYNSWKPRRGLYDPTFTKSYLRSLIPLFNECVDQFVEKLKGVANGKTEVPMTTQFSAITLHIIGKANSYCLKEWFKSQTSEKFKVFDYHSLTVAFGSDFSQPRSDEDLGLNHVKGDGTLGFLITHSLQGSQLTFKNPYYHLLHPFEAEGYRETIKAIRHIGRECILRRFKAIANNEEVPNDILTQIIRIATSSNSVAVEDLVDDFVTFFIAGQETTALLLSFALIMILQHPEVKQRVLDEISEVLGDRSFVTAEDVEQFRYLEQVFKEVLRLYTPAPATLREAPDDLTLSGYHIPEGSAILVHFYANHHNPDNWENPETFDPTRFGPGRERPCPFIYHPFSSGHRSCIGKIFALIEAKIIMARLLGEFQFSLQKDYKLSVIQSTTVRPADDVPCKITHCQLNHDQLQLYNNAQLQ